MYRATNRTLFLQGSINLTNMYQIALPDVENQTRHCNLFPIAQCHRHLYSWTVNAHRKVNLMGNIFELAEARATGRSPKPTGNDRRSHGKNAIFADRLLIIMDVLIYGLIEQLKDVLEAPSIGEVVRQAVRAYAIELASKGSVDEDVGFREESYTGQLKKLNVRIPTRTRERLEFLKDQTGETYTSIIFAGLGILARSADEQEGILRDLEKGVTNVRELPTKSGCDDDLRRHPFNKELVSDVDTDEYRNAGNQ